VDLNDIVKMESGRVELPMVTVILDCVMAYEEPQGGYGGYLPLELLRIEPSA
jgi:hypothetical protein